MQLNTAIWGTEADNAVELGSNRNIYYSNYAGAGSLGEYRVAHGMSEAIDESVTCWQLADFSMFNSVAYCRRDGNNTPVLDVCRAVKPKGIFLAVAPSVSNMTFNPAQSSNLMWSADVSNSIYTGTNYKILPWFNYNEIMAIFQLVTRKFDSDGKPTGSNVSRSIYSYYHDNDSDDLPLTTNWKIIAINVRFAHLSTVVDTFAPFGEDVSAISSAEIPFPQPNYYYSTGNYISYNSLRYANGVNSLGNQSMSSAGGYGSQQGAYGQSNNAYLYGYSTDAWEKRSYLNSSNQLIEYFNCTLDYEGMLRQCSTLGFWFNETIVNTSSATSWTNTLGTGCNDNNVILPEIKDGQTTGNYKRGVAAGADDQAAWGNNWRDNVGYTGDKPYKQGGDTGDLSTVFNRLALANNLSYYTADSLAIKQLISNLNTGYQPATQDQFILDFKGTNPADYISSVIFYPANFNCPYTSSSFTSIKIGAVTMTFPLGLNEADYSAGYYKEYSPITVPYYFNDFRDYAPYTVISLYVPFCGTVDLDPALFIGHTVTVRLLIDYLTGNCTGVIMRDNTAIDTISGSIGVSIPLTALANGSYQNAIKSAEIALKQAELQRKSAWLAAAGAVGAAVTGIASGNPLAIAGGIAGVVGAANAIESANLRKELAEYNIDHIAPSVDSVSAASPCNALGLDYDIHMLIRRCVSAEGEINGYDSGAYAATIGNACCISDVLGNFSGLTVCSNVKLDSIVSDTVHIGTDTFGGNAATAEEIELIRQALGSGVYM